VDVVQIEVVDAPVAELLAHDRFDPLRVVEGIPQLADYEELRACDKAFFDGPRNALARLGLVAIVCGSVSVWLEDWWIFKAAMRAEREGCRETDLRSGECYEEPRQP